MELPTDIPSVMENAGRYFMMNGGNIPELQRDKIVSVMGPGISPVDFVVRVAEALYSVADELDEEGLKVAAQAANLASINGWHGMSKRGNEMVHALRRRAGEEVAQEEDKDPEPLDEYKAPPVAPTTSANTDK